MGGVADAVGSFVSDVGGAVSDVVQSVGNITDSVVQEVGHAAESVGREVEKVGQAAANDPIGTIAKVAAVATGQVWALPIISAVDVIAHGGDIGQAALAAGVSYVGGAVASGVGDYFGAGAGSTVSDMMSQDAVNMVNQGLSSSQIADTLVQSYGVSSDVAMNTAAQAVLGNGASEIASSLASQYGPEFASNTFSPQVQDVLARTAGNTVGGMTRTALSGGDINQILMSGVTTGAGSLAGGLTTNELKDLGVNTTAANAIGKATGAATASEIGGKDARASFINSLINTTLTESGKQVNSALKSAWNSVNDTATKYNDQLKTAQDTFDKTVTPLQAEVKDLQTTAKASYDEYKPIQDKYDGLMAQFEDAKKAGNIELANSLVGQLNALAPDLNAAATKYNTDASAFETKNAEYTGAVNEYKTQVATADQIKTQYDQNNTELVKTADELKAAAAKVADMPDEAKKTFEQLYNNGSSATAALDTTTEVSKMSSTAQGTFMRNLLQTNDPTQALDVAKTVNNLSDQEQTSYLNGIRYGLDDKTALATAPNISNLSNTSQQIYLDAIKNGADPYNASVTATLAEMFGAPNTGFKNVQYAPTAATNTTGVVSDVGGSDPLVKVSGIETQSIGGTTFQYNPATGKFDIPVKDATMDGSSNATSLQSPDTSGTGGGEGKVYQTGTVVNPDGTITEKYSDNSTKIFDPNTGQYLSKGFELPSWVNNPNNIDTTVVGTGPTAATGSSPTGTTTTTTPTGGVGPSTTPTAPGTGSAGPGGSSGTSPTAGSPNVGGTGAGGTGTSDGTGTGVGGSGFGINIPGVGGTGGTGTVTTGTGGTGIKTTGTGGYNYNLYGQTGQDMYGGIRNLTPGLTDKLDYTLTGIPNIQETMNPIPQFATGSSVDSSSSSSSSSNTYDPFNTGTGNTSGISASLTPGFTKANLNYILAGMPGANIVAHADGGQIGPEGHNPTFFSEGGLNSIENRYVQGEGDGTSDSVAAMLANGEFVIPADVVSKLGNGSNEAGASVLDQFLKVVRTDANSNGDKLPPKSKGPLAYLLDAKRKMKA